MEKTPNNFLSQKQIDFFHKNGFISLQSITTQEEVETLKVAYDELFAKQCGREFGDHFDLAGTDEDPFNLLMPQILGPRRYSTAFINTIYERNASIIAKELLGPTAEFREDHAILKPAFKGPQTPWHQDEAYWDPQYEYNSISFWMPLQEVHEESGCMRFIPLTPGLKLFQHQSINGDSRIHGLELANLEDADTSLAISCPIPAGGVTIHKCRTLHYSRPNLSSSPRRAYTLSFSTPRVPKVGEKILAYPWNQSKTTLRQERRNMALATGKLST